MHSTPKILLDEKTSVSTRFTLPGLFCAILLLILACETESNNSQPGSVEATVQIAVTAVAESKYSDDVLPEEQPPYNRANWKHWIDEDGDCQDTRQEVLIAESFTEVTFEDSRECRVASGTWFDVYTGQIFLNPSGLDVDHLIPLANADKSGGWQWSSGQKQIFANDLADPDSLIAVSASANRSKGARDPSEWKPPSPDAWCAYASAWSRLKERWALDISDREGEAIADMRSTCSNDGQSDWPIPSDLQYEAGSHTDSKVNERESIPFNKNTNEEIDQDCGDFVTWEEANEFFMAQGGPLLDPHRLDGNHDGIPCESLVGAP